MSAGPLKPASPQILVLGNLAFETALVPYGASDRDSVRTYREWVGAITIQEMISQALKPAQNELNSPAVLPNRDDLSLEEIKANCEELTTIFGQFRRRSVGKETDTVWRVKKNYRAAPEAQKLDFYRSYLKKCLWACPNPDIVVIYDQDPKFRETFKKSVERPDELISSDRKRRSISALIVAMADDVDRTSIDAARRIFDVSTTIVILTADGLRRKGLNIVAYGSIEQTVREISGYLSKAPLKELLPDCSHLVILLEETGAVCITNTGGQKGSIHFCPNFDRVAQMDKETYGRAPGKVAVTLTAVTRAATAWIATSKGRRQPLDLDPSLRLAVVAYNLMYDKGFQKDNPFHTIKAMLSVEKQEQLKSTLDPINPEEEFLVSSLDFPTSTKKLTAWSRLDCVAGSDIANAIVLSGVKAACRDYNAGANAAQSMWCPAPQITCPYMEVGKFQTFDMAEIERLADLAKLLRKYHDDLNWGTPISIAVFGPPGAGKSFAVKQLMKAVNPNIKESSMLTFNLAQFDSLELLTEAFHQVQDQALSSDDVPLVIFDEFDSSFQQSLLGWLKYFLAPMEDGVFRGRSANYKVGRAVFLFAGGTAEEFKEFKEGPKSVDAKAVKLPDFVSRLLSHLDILGINPPPPGGAVEPTSEATRRRVRRATLLRSYLVDFAKPIMTASGKANIAPEVIDAFLNDKVTYNNQARSMKAVVRGARWIGKQFLAASLPSRSIIDQHTKNWP